MTNWFAGLGQAQSGLKAAQYGLTVVSQNITNEATPGYTRQISNQAAVDGSFTTGMHAGRGGMGGVTIVGTARTADIVLDARVRSEDALGAVADGSAAVFSSIEQVFPEPIDTGLSAQLGAIWSSFASVANSPQDAGTRTVLLQSLQTVAGTLNTMSSSLTGLTTSTSNYLTNDVASANSAATQLAQLNGQIAITAATGGNTNALLDTRDQLLDTLSKSFGAVATLNENGTADVSVGGTPLVTNVTAAVMSVDSSYQVTTDDGSNVSVSGGSAAGEIGALTSTIPAYTTQLDTVANNLISALNTIQSAGNDLSGTTGTDLLSGTGASDIAVTTTDGSKIAAAGPSGGTLDNANALLAAQYGAHTDSASPDASYAALVGDVAAKSALAQQQQATQAVVVTAVKGLQASVSGVDENEEITNMLTYQHAFSAASRVLTTLDSMLDTLINHTGLVGQA